MLRIIWSNIISLVSLTDDNENFDKNSDSDNNLQETHDSDDDVTVDGDFIYFNNRQNNHACSNGLDDFLRIFDPPDVETDNI